MAVLIGQSMRDGLVYVVVGWGVTPGPYRIFLNLSIIDMYQSLTLTNIEEGP